MKREAQWEKTKEKKRERKIRKGANGAIAVRYEQE